MRLYQIYDRVAGVVIANPLGAHNDGEAIRSFGMVLRDKATAVGASPRDFDLLYLGMQSEAGHVEGVLPVTVITGASLITALEANNV